MSHQMEQNKRVVASRKIAGRRLFFFLCISAVFLEILSVNQRVPFLGERVKRPERLVQSSNEKTPENKSSDSKLAAGLQNKTG